MGSYNPKLNVRVKRLFVLIITVILALYSSERPHNWQVEIFGILTATLVASGIWDGI